MSSQVRKKPPRGGPIKVSAKLYWRLHRFTTLPGAYVFMSKLAVIVCLLDLFVARCMWESLNFERSLLADLFLNIYMSLDAIT